MRPDPHRPPPRADRPPPWRGGPPPWSRRWRGGRPPWGRRWRGRGLFLRFALTFGLMSLLLVGGMGALAWVLTRAVGGGGPVTLLVWVGGCSLGAGLPLLAMALAITAFRRIAVPLTELMGAADAVAQGDLTVRVPQQRRGEFIQFAASFNRMVGELERADQQRRNLTADIAHELRTPLHIIQGNLEGLLDGVYSATPDHLQATLDETRHLGYLVEDLRTLSLMEAGQLPLRQESVDVNDLLADVVTSFAGQAEAAGVTLTMTVAPTPQPLTLTGDAGRLDQVLSNLVANALRHTAAGGHITLRAAPLPATPDGPGGVQLQVLDTGEGIAAAELPYIFDRFWRGDAARTRAQGTGSGLGLAIVRQLVRAHDGTISVDSAVGVGTTFTIGLPF